MQRLNMLSGLLVDCCHAYGARRQARMCQLFAVDMAYCGGEGLVTDKDSALVVMACSPVRYAYLLCVQTFPDFSSVACIYQTKGMPQAMHKLLQCDLRHHSWCAMHHAQTSMLLTCMQLLTCSQLLTCLQLWHLLSCHQCWQRWSAQQSGGRCRA